MPWISQRAAHAQAAQHAALVDRMDAMALAMDGLVARLDRVPGQIVQAVRDASLADVLARAQIRADTEAQPLSIGAADKQRVREQREKERETR